MALLRFILNIIWLVVAGLWLALGYALAGLICCVLIVTIPFGVASFRMANYALWPFGRTVTKRSGAGGGSTLGNVIWLIVAGWWLVLGHIGTAIGLAVTIIGIPMAWASLKMIPVALAPFGNEIVASEQARDPWKF
ncbi:YccF domain-containing protein [Nocardiopsis chromatogenes]|uniref:YccF domain-containing protein n=1 Tax=Nocardiopsis chromatogenes TaxID=280239 RepID=UPI00034A1168|nr:YccF domain-containing protein [Nocardiopsis chromatogenes]